MSSALFDITTHVVPGQHIREYPRATAHAQEDVLHLSVKQYTPRANPRPQPGDITILAAHANGFVKELYEPLWDDLLAACTAQGVGVRAIWMADVAWQGQSGVLNEGQLGNDPSWLDHARDLLHLTNHFRTHMPAPLIGIGHSFGGCIMTQLALLHPRLLTALVAIDAVGARFAYPPELGPLPGFTIARLSAARRDLWPSRAAAAKSLRQNKFYATWDPRALDLLVTHGFRDLPTALYPSASTTTSHGTATTSSPELYGAETPVTLTTTKHQEVLTYYRPTHLGPLDPATGTRTLDRALAPDIPADAATFPSFPFYQPVGPQTAARLPEVRPAVLWIAGGDSNVCTPALLAERMANTGVGIGGSGGAAAGRVQQHVIAGTGHLVAMEKPKEVAGRSAVFLRGEVERWRREAEVLRREWVEGVPDREKALMSAEYRALIDSVGPEANRRRNGVMVGPGAKL